MLEKKISERSYMLSSIFFIPALITALVFEKKRLAKVLWIIWILLIPVEIVGCAMVFEETEEEYKAIFEETNEELRRSLKELERQMEYWE